MKEQEAVEPIVTPWVEDEEGNIVAAKRECGRCRYQFFTERPNFCENCGTQILWEGRARREMAEELLADRETTAVVEGGGSTWWYVCEECHGAIDAWDDFCKHCGRKVRQEQ